MRAEIESDTVSNLREAVRDPFASDRGYVRVGTLFELNLEAYFTFYDTGWRLDNINFTSGRRLE